MLATYAEVLRAQGLRVRLQADGWFLRGPCRLPGTHWLTWPILRIATALYFGGDRAGFTEPPGRVGPADGSRSY